MRSGHAVVAAAVLALVVPSAAATSPADTLTLAGAIRAAVDGAPGLERERAELEAARAARWADWGAFLPSVSASAGFTRSDFTTVTFVSPEGVSRRRDDPLTGTLKSASQLLSLEWSLLEGGRRLADLSAGVADLEAASAHRDLAERRAVADVKRAYFEALQRTRLAELARRRVDGRRRDLALTRRRYRVADVGRSDLLAAEMEVEETRLALLDARDAARAAKRALQVAMGVEPAEGLALAPAPEPPSPSGLDPARLVRRALATSPELAAASAEAEAASARRRAAGSRYLPGISVGLDLSRSERLGPEGDLFVLDPRNTSRRFRVQASWTLFDGFRRRETRARASAEAARARSRRAVRRLELQHEVRELVAEIRRRARRVEVLRHTVNLARRRLELARERYRLGTFDHLELQNATRQLARSEERLTRERYGYLSAWADLEERAGDVRAAAEP